MATTGQKFEQELYHLWMTLVKATEYPTESARVIWPLMCHLTNVWNQVISGVFSCWAMSGHKQAVLLAFPFGPPDGAAVLNIMFSELQPQVGRRLAKRLSLSPWSPTKQEETLRLPAEVLGQNLTTWLSLDWQKGTKRGMIYLDPDAGHIIAQ